MENGATVEAHINAAIAKIGEKITLRRFTVLTKTDNDAFGAYLHMGGRISVLTVLKEQLMLMLLKMFLCILLH